MHRIAFVLAVALATPAVAEAPIFYDDRGAWRDRDRYRDRYRDRHDWRYGVEPRWRPLAGYINARTVSAYIRVPTYLPLSRVVIEGVHGAPVVSVVEVFYARHVQRSRIDRRLVRGDVVQIPIDRRRPVYAIVVHTDPRYRGGYSVHGG